MRDLFLGTLAIHRRSLSLPRPRLRNLEGTYDALYAVEIARRLPLDEIRRLGHATDLREEGLALARSGETDRGAELISEARRYYEGERLCSEARLLAEWFQTPAEAYLQYRRGQAAAAEASLLQAIEACVPLRTEYGYRVELRRVHLARNIVRVRNSGGRSLDALELAHRLLDYLEGVAEAWPWPSSAIAAPDVVEPDVRLLLTDQVLSDVARVLSSSRQDAGELARVAEEHGWFRAGPGRDQLRRARVWVAARSMAVRARWGDFLQLAGVFFGEPPGRLGMAWRDLTDDLARMGAVLAPDEAVDRSVD